MTPCPWSRGPERFEPRLGPGRADGTEFATVDLMSHEFPTSTFADVLDGNRAYAADFPGTGLSGRALKGLEAWAGLR